MRVSIAELEHVARRAILGYGYSEAEAEAILSVLMYAQLRGSNQGVVKLIGAGIPKDIDAGPISVANETSLSAVIDGGRNHAMVVVNHAVDVALRKAADHGIGLVGVHGLSTSSGAIGYYARRMTEQSMIGIVLAGSLPVVAAQGSYEPIFGTNPLAIAMPTNQEPIVLDMATAAMAWYGVVEAKTAGRDLPAGIAYDKAGSPTVDPTEALEGALRTFDAGVKGSGLAFMIQALTGPLVGASFAGIGDVTGNWSGHLVIAIDPQLLGGLAALRDGVSEMAAKVKASKRLPVVDEILLPGERGDRAADRARSSQEVDIEERLFHELCVVAGLPAA